MGLWGENIKVIFLDVDGELTYSDYENDKTANIDIEKVLLLKQICDKTDTKVVISSSWRGSDSYTPRIYHTLIDILTSNDIEVIGDTPHIKAEFDGDVAESIAITTLEDLPHLKIKHGTGRAAEVERWIQEHDIENFVILDDEDFDWCDYGYESNWIQPTWFGDGGLKKEHVDMAIKILNGK